MHDDLYKFKMYWEHFARQYLDQIQSRQILNILLEAYNESLRSYHTCQHIVECLELFTQIKNHIDDVVSLELAIWFHDVIYNPQAHDNEEQSADLMKLLCRNAFGKDVIEKVYGWIIATKQHTPSQEKDLNYLLDIDLAILGASPKRFAEYEAQIRQEYIRVDREIYQVKRRDVLKSFYQMQPLYQTAFFNDKFEQHAKRNLQNVIEIR
nr:metal-dependent hydrolase [Acinetobacter sp. Marseille-Q1620]